MQRVPFAPQIVLSVLVLSLCAPSVGAAARAQDPAPADRWPAFRGTGSGHSLSPAPLRWSEDENVAWRVELPGYGQSSPVVAGGRVFVTAAAGDRKQHALVAAYALEDGELLWLRRFDAATEIEATDTVSRGAPTPALDDERIVAFFESGDLIALDHDGETLWRRDLFAPYGPFEGNHGIASSPRLVDDRVVLQLEHSASARVLAFSAATGETLWQVEREPRISWTTPAVARDAAAPAIVYVSSNGSVEAYGVTDGEELASFAGVPGNTVQSPLLGDGLLVVAASKPDGNMVFASTDRATLDEPLWRGEDARASGFASPILHGGRLLVTNKAGVVTAVDPRTGKQLWKQRTAEGCWASPIASGELVYYFGENGAATVLHPSDEGAEVVAENHLPTEGRVYGVALAAGAFLVREGDRLTCVRSPVE